MEKTFVALLRGINVGGHGLIPMKELKTVFEELHFQSVRTYLQSGNVVFTSSQENAKMLPAVIEQAIASSFTCAATVIIRTPAQLAAAYADNPFLKEHGIDTGKLYMIFLSAIPDALELLTLKKYHYEPDRYIIAGDTVYCCYEQGAGKTRITINIFERVLKVSATSRNLNTVKALSAQTVLKSL